MDVSSHQGVIDWARVAAAGYSFTVAKLTEATNYRNPYHDEQVAGARAAGLVVGHYHYAQPDEAPAEAEADWFLAQLGVLPPGEPIALDLEEGSGNLLDWARRWLRRVTAALGVRPLLYSGHWFLSEHGLLGDDELSSYPLWYASWQAMPPPPPPNWPRLTIWQRSALATVPGVVGAVDEDTFDGSMQELRAVGRDQSPAPPAAVPQPRPDPKEPGSGLPGHEEDDMTPEVRQHLLDEAATLRGYAVELESPRGMPRSRQRDVASQLRERADEAWALAEDQEGATTK